MIHPTLAKINDYTSQPVSLMHTGLLAFFLFHIFFSFPFFGVGVGLLYKCVRLAWVSCLFVVILFAFFKGGGVCLTYVFFK